MNAMVTYNNMGVEEEDLGFINNDISSQGFTKVI